MIPFVKAHACGNDFLIVQEKFAATKRYDALARALCDRNQGIGADGVEFYTPEAERRGQIHLYNADGSNCGDFRQRHALRCRLACL